MLWVGAALLPFAFARSGFHGGVSWYRNIDRNFEQFPALGTQKLDLPCLMVTAEWDMALRPELAAGMPALCSDLETHMVAECGHWTQQEKPEELNEILIDWLQRRMQELLRGAKTYAEELMIARKAHMVIATKVGPIKLENQADMQDELLRRRVICHVKGANITPDVMKMMNDEYAARKKKKG